jgi:DnaJ-class molecular chaperone
MSEETIIERAKKTGHVGVARDELVQERNVASGKPLCEHCEGTGNEFYFMYHECPKCAGTGLAPSVPSEEPSA